MNIGVPRRLVIGMAALFSAYHLITAVYELTIAESVPLSLLAMLVYAVVTVLALVTWGGLRLPWWVAVLALVAAMAIPLLVVGFAGAGTEYPRWYVPAVGTLLTIIATRRRPALAWVGLVYLTGLTIVQDGPLAIVTHGVGFAVAWVVVGHVLSRAMLKADEDARRFALAEREAAEWQAAQEAHVFERQFRLGQTSSMALAMLRRIERSGGELTEDEREECLRLEAGIRDEIRGRRLLNDAVREQALRARRAGVTVTLLDEGGIDDMSESDLRRVHRSLAEAIAAGDADKIIARTDPEGSDVAVTVVGLRTLAGGAALDDDEEPDEEVTMWLEIPR